LDNEMNLPAVLAEIEDYLIQRKTLSVWERSLYYHLFRHTRVQGDEIKVFAIQPLAQALGMSQSSVRQAIRSLHDKGCARIEERSRRGHLLRVWLPSEIEGVVPPVPTEAPLDIEAIDFFTNRRLLHPLIDREGGRCFYCLRSVNLESCVLDHVVPEAKVRDNSYRNIVVSCHQCNAVKQEQSADDFLRSLYRQGVLSQDDLSERLATLSSLQAGHLLPRLSRGGS
jgi:hypothetical protein